MSGQIITTPNPPPEPLDPKYLSTAFFSVLFVASLIAVFYLFGSYLTDVVLATLFAVLFIPIYSRSKAKLPGPNWVSALVCTTILVVAVAGPAAFLVTSLSFEAQSAFGLAQGALQQGGLEEWLFGENRTASFVRRIADQFGYEYTPESIRGAAQLAAATAAGFVTTAVNSIVSNVFSLLFHFVIVVTMFFYLLLDGRRLKDWLYELSPLPTDQEELLATKFRDVGWAILFGNGLGSLIQGVLGGLIMAGFGLPSPVLWGAVMTFFAFLPLLGIGVVIVPATLFLFFTGQTASAVAFFAVTMGMGVFVENVVKTKLIGSHMKMHNMTIFLSIIAGIGVFGILGILYGPLTVALFLTLTELYKRHYRYRFMTDEETAQADTLFQIANGNLGIPGDGEPEV